MSSAAGDARRAGFLQGDGQYGMKVAGTSYHQSELQTLAGGKTLEGAHLKVRAFLLPEPDNPYDPDAVAIYIIAGGVKTGIGYLQANTAPLFNKALSRDMLSAATCDAMIVGGWHREQDSREDGYFGVRLNACLPFRLQPLALGDADHASPVASHPVRLAQMPAAPTPQTRSRRKAGLFLFLMAILGVMWLIAQIVPDRPNEQRETNGAKTPATTPAKSIATPSAPTTAVPGTAAPSPPAKFWISPQ